MNLKRRQMRDVTWRRGKQKQWMRLHNETSATKNQAVQNVSRGVAKGVKR